MYLWSDVICDKTMPYIRHHKKRENRGKGSLQFELNFLILNSLVKKLVELIVLQIPTAALTLICKVMFLRALII